MLSTQLSTAETAEHMHAQKILEATCASRFESVDTVLSTVLSTLDTEAAGNKADQVALLQQHLVTAATNANSMMMLHGTARETIKTLTEQIADTETKLASTKDNEKNVLSMFNEAETERARLQMVLSESKQIEETQKDRLLEMSQRVMRSEKESNQLRAAKLQCENECTAAREQLTKMAMELHKYEDANEDFEREQLRANKLGEQAKRLKRSLEVQEQKLVATSQKLGRERGRRLDAEAMLEDPAAVAHSRALREQQVSAAFSSTLSSSLLPGSGSSQLARNVLGGSGSSSTARHSKLPSFPRA